MDSTWDWSANSIDNFCALPMSLDDHAQGVKTVKLKTDGASQSESFSPVQTPHSSITQEVNQVRSLKFHYNAYHPRYLIPFHIIYLPLYF